MPLITSEFSGLYGYVIYGSTMMFAESWQATIEGDSIDLTTIDVYPDVGMPAKETDPYTPYLVKAPADPMDKIANYGAARQNYFSNLRKATITLNGFAAKAYENQAALWEVFFPRIGNIVRMEFANRLSKTVNMFVFPKVIITNVDFSFNVKEYTRFTMTGISDGEFDIFPGPDTIGT